MEINSSFHRPHRVSTYAGWAASVPEGFRFSVKVPKEITHAARLESVDGLLDDFMPGPRALGEKLGCLLVQLPPSLAFEAAVAERFLTSLRDQYQGEVACEPRHATWLRDDAEDMLDRFRVARVAADPDRPPGAGEPGAWAGLRYYRLHGSPRMYYSSYPGAYLERVAERLTAEHAAGRAVWCVLDNTAHGAATLNALDLVELGIGGG